MTRLSRIRAVRRPQRGLSLIGLLLSAALVIAVVLAGLRVVPTVLEFFAIRSAVEKVATSGAATPRDIQVSFDRYAAVDDIESITGRDLLIERVDGGLVVSFSYEKRVDLFGPVALLIHYHGSSRP